MNQRPLCIDSKVVERIDRLNNKELDTVFRCAVNKETAFSSYFNENSRPLAARIQKMERLLESVEPFKRKIHLMIFDDKPLLFRVHDHSIYIGRKLLDAPGHLEKAIAKVWFREKNDSFFVQQALLEEVVTDFMLYLDAGDLNIGDPSTQVKTALRKVKWPYVLKSVGAYCDSAWKKSEHFDACDKKEVPLSIETQVIEMSLRPLLLHTWVRSYYLLPLRERLLFAHNLSALLKADHAQGLPVVESNAGVAKTDLERAAEAIKNVSHFISKSNSLKEAPSQRLFVSNFTSELRTNGFQGAFAEASFDLLFVTQSKLEKKDSAELESFFQLAKANPKLQIAVRTDKNIWMLPSKYPIPLDSFGAIRSNRTVVEKCGGYNFSFVMDYAEKTEKLLVANHCDKDKQLSYTRFLKEGAEGFGMENKGASFVQFHLPSLLMKRTELETVSNVFEFIQKRDVESAPFKSLGWSEVQWSEQANAYKPKAFVDAIEWFRLPL